MKKNLAGIWIAFVGMGIQALPAAATQLTPVAGLTEMLESAEAVVAVEILNVDLRATEADGPLILEVLVLEALKGRVTTGQTLSTWEAAQVAGTYRVGQQRLLLLKRQRKIEPYHRKAAWWNMPIGLEIFIEDIAIEQLTLKSLQEWLDEHTQNPPAAPRVVIRRTGRSFDVLEMELSLLNPTEQVIWLNPSSVSASFDAGQRHFITPIEWDAPETGAWFALEPGGRLFGTVSVPLRLPKDLIALPITLEHLTLSFPRPRVWIGYLTTEAKIVE